MGFYEMEISIVLNSKRNLLLYIPFLIPIKCIYKLITYWKNKILNIFVYPKKFLNVAQA